MFLRYRYDMKGKIIQDQEFEKKIFYSKELERLIQSLNRRKKSSK